VDLVFLSKVFVIAKASVVEDRSSEDEAYRNTYGAYFKGIKRLRGDRIGTSDGTTEALSAIAYGERLSMLANILRGFPCLPLFHCV
jgi:hypothetical protein